MTGTTAGDDRDVPSTETAGESYRIRLRRDMVRGSIWTLVASLALVPVSFVANLLIAHKLGPAGLGNLATCTAILGFALTIANGGTSDATVQWLAEARARGWVDREIGLIRRCAGYHTFIEGPVVAVTAIVILRHTGVVACAVAAGAVWITQILGTSTVVLTATARNAAAARFGLVVTMATQVTAVAVAESTHSSLETFAFPLAATAFGPLFALFALDVRSRRAVLTPVLSWDDPAGFRKYGVSACAASLVATLVFGRSEIFILKENHLALATGLFALATGLASQITVPMDSLMGPLMPTIAGLYATAPHRARSALERALRVTSALGAVTSASIVPTLFILIPVIYGRRFEGCSIAFEVLAMTSCLQSVILPLGAFALVTRSAAAVLRTDLMCLAVDATLAVALIPTMGLYGAVAANSAAQLLSLLLLTRVVVNRLDSGWRDVLVASRVFAVGPLIGVAVSLVAIRLPFGRLGAAAAAGLTGLVLFRVLLAIFAPLRLDPSDIPAIAEGLPARVRGPFVSAARFAGLSPRVAT